MRKCPRCGHDVREDDKFCPHCGLDLRGDYRPIKPKHKQSMLMFYILVFFFFAAIPLLYTFVFDKLMPATGLPSETMALPAISEKQPTRIIGQYDTLSGFQSEFNNVDDIIERINAYEEKISQNGKYTFDKAYVIQVLDNYNIYYKLTYTTKINDSLSVVVEREFDRAHQYNDENIKFKKTGIKDFDHLFFNQEEMEIVYSLTGQQTTSQELMERFKSREKEFNEKKKSLGHYGIGEYDGQSSFVVYRYGDDYQSELTYASAQKDYIG